MAGLLNLPLEVHTLIYRYLAGTPSIKAIALACMTTSRYVKFFRDKERVIDLRTGRVSIIHGVIAQLASQANNGAIAPPNIEIRDTGHRFADAVIQYASYFRTVWLDLPNEDGVSASVDQQLRSVYRMLLSQLDPQILSDDHEFWDGSMSLVFPLLMRLTQYISNLELRGSLLWMQRADLSGSFTRLHTLQLSGLANSVLPSNCGTILQLPSLNTLEFSEMKISYKTVSQLSALSVTRLHFVNCHVNTLALPKAIRACLTLKSFTCILRTARWTAGKDFNMAQLLHALSSRHANTLQHLTIRTLGVRVNVKECQYSEELSEFRNLETLSIDHYMLHFNHLDRTDVQCEETYEKQYNFFTSPKTSPPEPIQILSALADSLYRLEVSHCDKAPMWYALLDLMDAKLKGRLRSLRAVKVTYERPAPGETIWSYRASTQARKLSEIRRQRCLGSSWSSWNCHDSNAHLYTNGSLDQPYTHA